MADIERTDSGIELKIRAVEMKLAQDPRLIMLKWKYDPTVVCPEFVDNGLQKAKIAYDPSHIPWFGLTVKMYRAGDSHRMRSELDKACDVVSANQTNISDEEISSLKHNMNAQVAMHNSKATFSVLVSFIPGGDLILFGVRKAAESVVVKVTRKVDSHEENSEDPAYQTHENYLASKAFFTYLGLPLNNDPLFRRWERERLFMKAVYGAQPEDDLRGQEPTSKEISKLKKLMDSTPKEEWTTEKLGHCPLWFMWRIYNCWTGLYWDKHMNFAWKVLQDKNHRYKEDRDTMRVWASHTGSSNNPHIRKAKKEDLDRCMEIFQKLKTDRMDLMKATYPLAYEHIINADKKPIDPTFRVHFENFIEKDNVWVYQVDEEKEDSFDCWVVWGKPKAPFELFEKKKLQLLGAMGDIQIDLLKEIHHVFEARHVAIEKRSKETKDLYAILHYFLVDGTRASVDHLKILLEALCDEAVSVVSFASAAASGTKVPEEEIKNLRGRELTVDDCEDLQKELEEFYKSHGFNFEPFEANWSRNFFEKTFGSKSDKKIRKVGEMYLQSYFRASIVPPSHEMETPHPMVN